MVYDPKVGAQLYNRYLDEKIYADQIGFDALMLNEHHSTPLHAGRDERRRLHPGARNEKPKSSSWAISCDLGRSALAGRATGDD